MVAAVRFDSGTVGIDQVQLGGSTGAERESGFKQDAAVGQNIGRQRAGGHIGERQFILAIEAGGNKLESLRLAPRKDEATAGKIEGANAVNSARGDLANAVIGQGQFPDLPRIAGGFLAREENRLGVE